MWSVIHPPSSRASKSYQNVSLSGLPCEVHSRQENLALRTTVSDHQNRIWLDVLLFDEPYEGIISFCKEEIDK
jgi:hypothetical protein